MKKTYKELQHYYEFFYDEKHPNDHKGFKKAVMEAANFLDSLKGQKSFPLYLYCVLNDISEPPKCPVCGLNVGTISNRFGTYCSRKCVVVGSKDKRIQTMIDRYGVENPSQSKEFQEKKKITSLERYGVENPSQSKEVKDKNKKTCLARYGVESYLQTTEIREKTKQLYLEKYGVEHNSQTAEYKESYKKTSLERYGVEHPSKSDAIKEKNKQTNNEKYGVDYYTQTDEYKERVKISNNDKYGVDNVKKRHIPLDVLDILNDKIALEALYKECGTVTKMVEILGVSDVGIGNYLRYHEIEVTDRFQTSSQEKEISMFLSSLNVPHQMNQPLLGRKEVDIYIDSCRVGIEFNGIYWHSSKFRNYNYHQEKSLIAMENGIQLLHVWEDDWNDETKQTIIKNKIKSKLGLCSTKIPARKCKVEILYQEEARSFMDTYHIQGKTTASLWLGLRHTDKLVACLGIKKTKDGYIWDLVRYATSDTVIGGFSKLFSYFKKNYEWSEVFTYAALDYSHGDLYEKTGFTKSHITSPGLWYVYNGIRHRREKFMKHKLKDKLEAFDETLTEKQNMLNHGFHVLYDSGSIKYIIKKEDVV